MAAVRSLHTDCWCFSTCTPEATADFLNLLPRSIRRSDTAWLGYLRTVYGDALAAPFSLGDLTFFYHPSVATPPGRTQPWPMAPCALLLRRPICACLASDSDGLATRRSASKCFEVLP